MKPQKRLLAGIMCIGMLLVLFVSSAYIAHEASHDCAGEACEICERIAQTEAVLQSFLLLGAVLLALFALITLTRTKQAGQGVCSYAVSTLVSWKVRLNS
ncbi:MAG: hypothetical protein IJ174_05695 [Clostridia bacterium]|nr:hypothetical protein [Clostridia bacterium]